MTDTSTAADDRLSTPEAYDRRRTGSGSVTRPDRVRHTTRSTLPPFHPRQRPTVADLMTRVYGPRFVPAPPAADAADVVVNHGEEPSQRSRRADKGGVRRHG